MTGTGSSSGQLIGGAAEVYDAFFVPALFGAWAPKIAAAARIGPTDRALDVACGTGVLALELAKRAQSVAGLDRNLAMLARARSKSSNVEWQHGRAEALPFADDGFDVVASQFGLMFFEDRARSIAEMRRVLRPGGRLVVAVWAGLDRAPGYARMVELLHELYGPSLADELRAPFALGDVDELKALFAEGGVAPVEVETVSGRARFPSLAAWLHTDIRGWTLADRIDDAQYGRLALAAATHLSRFVGPGGAVSFECPALVVRYTAPHDR